MKRASVGPISYKNIGYLPIVEMVEQYIYFMRAVVFCPTTLIKYTGNISQNEESRSGTYSL
jgi:hypothetical protein